MRHLSDVNSAREKYSVQLLGSLQLLTFIIIFFRKLGTSFDNSPHFGDAQLGNGMQEMVSGLQDPYLLRYAKGAEGETYRLDEAERFPHLHHVVQARHTGPPELQAEEMEVPDTRRGAEHKELQVATLAAAAQLSDATVSVFRAVFSLLLFCVRSSRARWSF